MNNDQFQRTRMLIGDDAMQRLQTAKVAVFGVGGVGGHAVEVIARSGIGAIDLFDADDVSLTNLNRQIIALHSTIGRPKVDVAKERIADINPMCKVTANKMFYLPENADGVDLSQYDYVVDCVDTMSAKIELITRCKALNVPIISSMGAANKFDPTAFRVCDIFKTQGDPLAKVIRKKMRQLGIRHLKVVCSEELPQKPNLTDTTDAPQTDVQPTMSNGENLKDCINECNENLSSNCQEHQNLKLKPSSSPVPASNAFVPAAAGIIIGGEVIKDIAFNKLKDKS